MEIVISILTYILWKKLQRDPELKMLLRHETTNSFKFTCVVKRNRGITKQRHLSDVSTMKSAVRKQVKH